MTRVTLPSYRPTVDMLRAVMSKIRMQVTFDEEASNLQRMYFAIFEQAVKDCFRPDHLTSEFDRMSAVRYLNSDIEHLEMVGVDSDWARGVILKGLQGSIEA